MAMAIASTKAIPPNSSNREIRGMDDEPALRIIANFLSAMRTRKYQDLHADVDIGRISADLCHLANISYRLGGR